MTQPMAAHDRPGRQHGPATRIRRAGERPHTAGGLFRLVVVVPAPRDSARRYAVIASVSCASSPA